MQLNLIVPFAISALTMCENGMAQENYGTCVADPNPTPPAPDCGASSITWVTGGAHCYYAASVNSTCVSNPSTGTRHTENVAWYGGFEYDNYGTYDSVTGVWTYPPLPSNLVQNGCAELIGYSSDKSIQKWGVMSDSVGPDNQTSAQVSGCIQVDLL